MIRPLLVNRSGRPAAPSARPPPPPPPATGPVPLVILLDLDGTVAGRVGAVLAEYEIHRALGAAAVASSASSRPGGAAAPRRPRPGSAPQPPSSWGGAGAELRGDANSANLTNVSSSSHSGGVQKSLRDAIVSRLRYGIIRPHVLEFCQGMKSVGGTSGVELFVYTASEASWANFFVPCVESALGMRFNRPILTRDHCVRQGADGTSIRKTIDGLRPILLRSLRRRYPGLRTVGDLSGRVLLVDNTPDVMADPRENARLVVCPTYPYAYVYDVLCRVPVDSLHSLFSRLVPVLVRNGMFPNGPWTFYGDAAAASAARPPMSGVASPGAPGRGGVVVRRLDSFGRFAAVYYRRLARLLEAAADPNDQALARDRFFLRLLNAVHALVRSRPRPAGQPWLPACFDDAGVRELNAATSRRMQTQTQAHPGRRGPPAPSSSSPPPRR